MADVIEDLDETMLAERARFWGKVHIASVSAVTKPCWEWTGSKNRKGYGQFRRSAEGRETDLAHRFAFLITRGSIPRGMFVCHKCDNPACVRPSHLFLGTALDNNRDREAKGRGHRYRGEHHPRAKFTNEQAAAIVAAVRDGESKRSVARRYSTNTGVVNRAIARVEHAHG